jgi:hypothetical protein
MGPLRNSPVCKISRLPGEGRDPALIKGSREATLLFELGPGLRRGDEEEEEEKELRDGSIKGEEGL